MFVYSTEVEPTKFLRGKGENIPVACFKSVVVSFFLYFTIS